MYLFITIKLLYILHATRQIVAYCKTEYKTDKLHFACCLCRLRDAEV